MFFFFFFNYKIIRVGGGINGKIHGICPVNFVNVSSISISQDILSCHLQLVIVSTVFALCRICDYTVVLNSGKTITMYYNI